MDRHTHTMGFVAALTNMNPLKRGKGSIEDNTPEDISRGPPVSLEEGARTGQVDMNSTVTFGTDQYREVTGNTTTRKAPKKL